MHVLKLKKTVEGYEMTLAHDGKIYDFDYSKWYRRFDTDTLVLPNEMQNIIDRLNSLGRFLPNELFERLYHYYQPYEHSDMNDTVDIHLSFSSKKIKINDIQLIFEEGIYFEGQPVHYKMKIDKISSKKIKTEHHYRIGRTFETLLNIGTFYFKEEHKITTSLQQMLTVKRLCELGLIQSEADWANALQSKPMSIEETPLYV